MKQTSGKSPRNAVSVTVGHNADYERLRNRRVYAAVISHVTEEIRSGKRRPMPYLR